jgi:hypothetical protein
MGDAEAGGRQSPAVLPSPGSIEGVLLTCCASELAAQVLVVGHHGSRTSSRRAFLDAVGASVFVVSSGPKTYSGVVLPDADVIAELEARGQLFRTDVDVRRVPRILRRSARTLTGSPLAATTSGCSLAVRRLCRCRCLRVLIRPDPQIPFECRLWSAMASGMRAFSAAGGAERASRNAIVQGGTFVQRPRHTATVGRDSRGQLRPRLDGRAPKDRNRNPHRFQRIVPKTQFLTSVIALTDSAPAPMSICCPSAVTANGDP